jgi:nucleoside 2-deoxyribosyltransferase
MAAADAMKSNYRYAATVLAAVAVIIVVTTVREINTGTTFAIGLICALGALALAMHGRVLHGQREIVAALLYLYDHFDSRLSGVEDTAGTVVDGVDGIVSIFERSRRSQNGDGGTGGQPIQIRR